MKKLIAALFLIAAGCHAGAHVRAGGTTVGAGGGVATR